MISDIIDNGRIRRISPSFLLPIISHPQFLPRTFFATILRVFALVSHPDNILRCRQFALPILFFQNFHIRQDMLDNARDRYSCSPASICRRHGLCLCLFYVELGYRSTLQYFSVATMKSVAGTQYFETRRNCKVVKKIFYSFAIVRA